MEKNTTWKEELVCVLQELGGAGTYADIYEKVVERNTFPKRLKNNTWKCTVRNTIKCYSSDSKNYRKGREDLFFAVDGLGNGKWGLRNFHPFANKIDLTNDAFGFPEGKKKLREHLFRERNPELIKNAKKEFKEKHNGKLFCEACGIHMKEKYKINEEFIEGHHEIPISELETEHLTRVQDIIMLCPNCHSMIHKIRPWIKRENLKELFIQKNRV